MAAVSKISRDGLQASKADGTNASGREVHQMPTPQASGKHGKIGDRQIRRLPHRPKIVGVNDLPIHVKDQNPDQIATLQVIIRQQDGQLRQAEERERWLQEQLERAQQHVQALIHQPQAQSDTKKAERKRWWPW